MSTGSHSLQRKPLGRAATHSNRNAHPSPSTLLYDWLLEPEACQTDSWARMFTAGVTPDDLTSYGMQQRVADFLFSVK